MGMVYLAREAALDCLVAVKVLRPELVTAEGVTRFVREAQILAKLRHPNIVVVHKVDKRGGLHFYVMEHLDGDTLQGRLERHGHLTHHEARKVGRDLLEALEVVHRRGVIHRDVKPSNVRIAADGRAMLLDFGLSLASELPALSVSGSFHGTPYYASPEQIDAAMQTLDARTDVYSLGATLYEAVTGRAPFEASTTAAVFHQILTRDPLAPRRVEPSISRDLETVIQKAMEKERERRYPSAEALADDLRALLEMRPIAARPAGPLVRAAKWARRNRAAAASAGVMAIALVVVLAMAWNDQRRGALAFQRELDAAGASVSSGDFASAISAIDRALGLRPGDASALARRGQLVVDKSRAEARVALAAARARMAHFSEQSAAATALQRDLEPLRQAVTKRYMSPEEQARMASDEKSLAELVRQLDLEFSSIVDTLNFARGLDEQNTAAGALLADLYFARWREARDARDVAGERHYRALVEQNDSEGRHRAEFVVRGAFAIDSDPPGAQVFLFRFVEQTDVVSAGEPRLVPVPVGGDAPPRPPGTWALRVIEDLGELRQNDLLLSVGGYPIEGTMLVSEGGPSLYQLDRLVSIDGRATREIQDVNVLGKTHPEQLKHFEFERDGRRFALEANLLRDLLSGGWAVEPDTLVADFEVPAELYRMGETSAITTPRGLRVRTTAAPLFASPACSVGATPIARGDLEPGSYVALLRRDGFDDARVPFVVERGGDTHASARLVARGGAPRGFVFVPGGPFQAGDTAEAFGAWPVGAREVADFWIIDREIVEIEYAEFLDDPATLAEIDRSPVSIRFPRSPGEATGEWSRDADGRFVVPSPRNSYPIGGISWDDADAYARWFDVQRAEEGDPFTYALPTEEEWEKAARGVDGRSFVYGDHFSPGWAKGQFARDAARDADWMREPGLRFPRDESVYGVFDMCASQWEWCADVWTESDGARAVRGGARSFVYTSNFRAAARAGAAQSATMGETGFRLVAHRRKP